MRVVAVRVEAKVEEADALATQVFEESLMPLVIPTVAAASISADLTHEKSRAALRDMPKEPLPPAPQPTRNACIVHALCEPLLS